HRSRVQSGDRIVPPGGGGYKGPFATYRRVSCPFASTICRCITACSVGSRRRDLIRATLRGEFRGLLRAFEDSGGPVMTIASLKIESNVTVREEVLDQLEVVGDLIRQIENVNNDRRRRSIVEASPPVIRI